MLYVFFTCRVSFFVLYFFFRRQSCSWPPLGLQSSMDLPSVANILHTSAHDKLCHFRYSSKLLLSWCRSNPSVKMVSIATQFGGYLLFKKCIHIVQPQHEHMERHRKLHGVRMDQMERQRKREARSVHKLSEFAQRSFGLRAKMFNQKRFKEKAAMRKTLSMHQEGSNKHSNQDKLPDGKVSIMNVSIYTRVLM